MLLHREDSIDDLCAKCSTPITEFTTEQNFYRFYKVNNCDCGYENRILKKD